MLAQAPAERSGAAERLHAEYRIDAEKYAFFADGEHTHPLMLIEKPVMKWANDDDWSGDVFLWTRDGLPAVVGSMLSGPGGENRNMYHEFHLLDSRPLAPVKLQTRRTWQPAAGLKREPVPNQKPAADTPAGRLVQMRQIAKSFTAHMEADGPWELRLLPQPLVRYGGDAGGEVIDGAIFTWVWSKGTDPELMMLVELRTSRDGTAWYYAPVRFSNRALWLKYDNIEVWRAESHREPSEAATSLIYTTAYARFFPREAPAGERKPQ